MRFRPHSSLFPLLLAAALGSASLGCARGAQAPALSPAQTSDRPATKIAAKDFPETLHKLLISQERDEKSKLLLAGAVQYQLARADKLFADGFTQEAEDMVTGALLLLRHDDELRSATRDQSSPLVQAGHAAAKMGDAGRAAALYELALSVSEDSTLQAELKQHLQAIKTWNVDVGGDTALQQLGEKTRAALSRSVVDPRAENYLEARDSIIAWMEAALTSSAGENAPATVQEREYAMEAYRAVRTGAPAMVALNLRQGTPALAVSALKEANLERALPPALSAHLESTAQKDSADSWLILFRQFEEMRMEGASEASLPRYVNDAASFWAALGLYRHSAGGMQYAMPLSMTLVELGMPEVASTVLAKNCDDSTEPEALAWAVSLVLRSLVELSRTDQLQAARQSYQEAAPLLTLSESIEHRGPSPARVKMLMAALETRHAEVKAAQQLLLEALKTEQNPAIYLHLSRLAQQLGDLKAAEQMANKAIAAAREEGDLLAEAEGEEAIFRITRNTGRHEEAAAALDRALARTVVLQKMTLPNVPPAAAERQLASLLEYYSKTHEIRASYRRALDASRSNMAEIEATLTEMARAALTLGDEELSRQAVSSAIDLGLPAENAIYIALWHQLLQKQKQTAPDGLSRQVFEQAGRAHGWIASLRKFGLGELSAAQLSASAQGVVEKTEADFYGTITASTASDKLLAIADSPAIDLIEVRIAADLKAAQESEKQGLPAFTLPSTVELP